MNTSIESLLEDDHESLGKLLTEFNGELTKPNIAQAAELLDLFWARLAVHIRAENLHLFPALANTPTSLLNRTGSLPTSEEVQNLLAQLRSDHDFFMKELAVAIKTMRDIAGGKQAHREELEDVRQRLAIIAKRMEAHNRLEEMHAYTWPTLLFDQQKLDALCAGIAHELENLPPRFAK
jgi:hemerythrin HHE cation binding domain-containing protein